MNHGSFELVFVLYFYVSRSSQLSEFILMVSYRPHGQHSVILAQDVPKYMEFIGDKNEHGGFIAGSRQIYLTFPSESTFTEQDVSNYFR